MVAIRKDEQIQAWSYSWNVELKPWRERKARRRRRRSRDTHG
jgi:hypothetical protein